MKLLDEQERLKIPGEIIKQIEDKVQNTNESLRYDANGMPILSEDAEAMLLYIYKEYILDNELLQKALNMKMQENQKTKTIIKRISLSKRGR